MEKRVNIQAKGQEAFKAMYGLGKYLSKSSLEESLLNLVYFRVSQINGCAFCLDMHAKDLRESGETEQRLYVLNAWREAPFYSKRERAAFAWAEAVTKLSNGAVSDEVYREASKEFSEQELIDLTMAVITINSYNRINLAFPMPELVGTYHPGQFAVQSN
jgi:AhpD family alkylhydroperoxidase